MSKLTIIRGTPGSHKTTFAKDHFQCLHLEADMFFERDGKYSWNAESKGANHKWCQETCEKAISMGMDVVVSNTFTTRKEIKPYKDIAEKYGAEFSVIKCIGRSKNTHGVPEDTLRAMTERWEDWDGERVAKPDAPRHLSVEESLFDDGVGLVNRMLDSKFVKVKDAGEGIQSLNYNKKAFFGGKWNDVTMHARGLFVRGVTVVARSFDKFFRIGEVPETKIDAIVNGIGANDRVFVARKYNGYLGILSYDFHAGCWRFYSKTSFTGTYATHFREIAACNPVVNDVIRNMPEARNYSFVFEVVDNKLDPHFVLNDDVLRKGNIILIGMFENKLDDDGKTYDEIHEFLGPKAGDIMPVWLELPTSMATGDELRKYLAKIANDQWYDCGDQSTIPNYEGAVVTVKRVDGSLFRFKVKSGNYCYWKHVRRFIEKPTFNDRGYLEVNDYNGRPEELIMTTPAMGYMTMRLRTLTKDDLQKFVITDLGGRDRVDMIKLSRHMEGIE